VDLNKNHILHLLIVPFMFPYVFAVIGLGDFFLFEFVFPALVAVQDLNFYLCILFGYLFVFFLHRFLVADGSSLNRPIAWPSPHRVFAQDFSRFALPASVRSQDFSFSLTAERVAGSWCLAAPAQRFSFGFPAVVNSFPARFLRPVVRLPSVPLPAPVASSLQLSARPPSKDFPAGIFGSPLQVFGPAFLVPEQGRRPGVCTRLPVRSLGPVSVPPLHRSLLWPAQILAWVPSVRFSLALSGSLTLVR
jgi:hypothetical protein